MKNIQEKLEIEQMLNKGKDFSAIIASMGHQIKQNQQSYENQNRKFFNDFKGLIPDTMKS